MSEKTNIETEYSAFLEDTPQMPATQFDRMTPINTTGATSSTFVVSIKGREFFMKRLKAELKDNPTYYNLYHKEFDLGQRLDSPYIVKYHQLVEDEEGIYLLCEHVCGTSLDNKIKAAPEWFTVRRNLDRMFCQLLDALEHMHQQHVVHADLKPQNLMLTRINNDVKVIDLGFAFADDYVLSAGYTPRFAAPEQQQCDYDAIDTSTDIYGVGKLLEYIHTETDQGLPKVYQRIMKKCLYDEQSKRFQSTSEIREAILHRSRVVCNSTIASCTLAVLGLIAFFFCNTTTGKEFLESVRWTFKQVDYDVYLVHGYYRFQADDSTKCMIVGGSVRMTFDWADDTDNIHIQRHIKRPNGDMSKVVAVADSAFYMGGNFTSIHFPDGLEMIGKGAFEACKKITVINLPPSVREIGKNAFSLMTNLQTLHLPDSIESLPYGVAHHCEKLKLIKIPEKVRILPFDGFAACTSLQEVIMPPHLERIERGVFWRCTSLQKIALPATIKYIGEFAFLHCDNLKDVYIYATEPPQMCSSFNRNSKVTIHVPKAAESAYKSNIYWKGMNIVGDL